MSSHRTNMHTCECLLTSSEGFHTDADVHLRDLLAVPFWNLTRNLVNLSLEFGIKYELKADQTKQEQNESILASFKVPTTLPITDAGRARLHLAIANRTIIAAARTGHLKSLRVSMESAQRAFAIRALLPYWIKIEEWIVHPADLGWLGAAYSLRRLLAHASLWLHSPH